MRVDLLFFCYSVLIGRKEVVKISDFGTSRQWNEISTKMSFAGTVAWMAPEIIRNEPCSEKVDIWYNIYYLYFNSLCSVGNYHQWPYRLKSGRVTR